MTAEQASQPQPIVPGVPDGELVDLLARREVAVQTTQHIADVLDVPVDIGMLMQLAQEPEPSVARLTAKRVLRAVEAVSREDSPVLRAIGETGLYDFAEAVVTYGAGTRRYVELMEAHGLTPDEATAAYELRRMVAHESDGTLTTFPAICRALAQVGLTLKDAVLDTDVAVGLLADAGFFLDHSGTVMYNGTIFAPGIAALRRAAAGRNIDSVKSWEPLQYVRDVTESQTDITDAEE